MIVCAVMLLCPLAARADVAINEVYADMIGANDTGEFIELYNTGLGAHEFGPDDYLIVVDFRGSVHGIFPLAGLSILPGDTLLFGDDPILGPFPGPTVPDFSLSSNLGNSTDTHANEFSETYAVVELTGSIPITGEDIDADDDGVIDFPGLVIGALADGVAMMKASGFTYLGALQIDATDNGVGGNWSGFVRVPDGLGAFFPTAHDPDNPVGDEVVPTPDRTYPQPQITGVSPTQATNCEIVTITISGTGLVPGPTYTTVKLALDGSPDIAGIITGVTYGTAITAEFNVRHADAGVWDVVVAYPDGQADTLAGAFEVTQNPAPCLCGRVGDLYVTSESSDKVVQFDGVTGAFVCEFVNRVRPLAGPGESFSSLADGLAFGPNGNLFVASRGSHRIREFDGQTGALIGDATPVDPPVLDTAGPSANWLAKPYDLLFLRDGRLVVNGTSNHALMAYDGGSGESLGTFARRLRFRAVPDPGTKRQRLRR